MSKPEEVSLAIERKYGDGNWSFELREAICDAILAAKAEERQNIDDLVDCLSDMTFHYVALAGCGDCGNWNPEEESEVIAARQMIARHRDVNTAHKNSEG